MLGVMIDGGLPAGLGASVVFRPWSWLRLNGGGAYNLISPGINGGVSLDPFDTAVHLTLTGEVGRQFPGDVNKTIALLNHGQNPKIGYLGDVGYDFVNAHVGLEFGRDWFTFFVHAGFTYIHATVTPTSTSSNITFPEDASLHGWAPSGKVGFIIYVL